MLKETVQLGKMYLIVIQWVFQRQKDVNKTFIVNNMSRKANQW